MIRGDVRGQEALGATLTSANTATAARLAAALTIAAEATAGRLQAALPPRLASAVRVAIEISDDDIHVGIYVAGKRANAYFAGVDTLIDVSAYTRTVTEVFGRPVNPFTETVRAYQRHYHTPPHDDVSAIIRDGVLEMSAAAAMAAQEGGTNAH